ncbi:MAG: glutaredoxin domain-containing protein [Rikenellaceae bacterium]
MKKITMFIQPRCPFCVKALKYIDEAKANYPELDPIEIEIHDELKEPEFADKFDYYYVPTFYIGEEKVHEGGIYADEVVELLKKAL